MPKLYVESQEEEKVRACAGKITVVVAAGLEALTGADALLTPLPIPFSPPLLKRHMDAGAVLVQIKRGHDLSSSIVDNRLNHAVVRMRDHTPYAAQRVILFLGLATPGTDGNLLIDNRAAKVNGSNYMAYATYLRAQAALAGRGGTFVNLPNSLVFETWCEAYLDKVREMLNEPVKEVFEAVPSKNMFADDPMQDVRLIPGAWQVLASISGVGPKMVKALVKEYGGNYGGMLEELTNPRLVSAVGGLGKGKIMNIRHLFNLKPWEYLGVLRDRALLSEHGGWDDERCETCPRRGETRFYELNGKSVACDLLECKK